jgi:alpha-1,2-mannosyltransferase/arabinofuranan 3-O-arabinosyltransferase
MTSVHRATRRSGSGRSRSADVVAVLPAPYLRRARTLGRGLVLLLAATALATAVAFYLEAGSFVLARLVSREWKAHTDFETFWQSARALLNGQDIYATRAHLPNLNPPVMTLVLAPLGWLGFWPAYRAFTLLSVALVVASVAAVATELRVRPAAAITVLTAVLVSSPVLATLGLGQVYPLLAAGITAAWILGRRGHAMGEGTALGLVVAMKPSLAPLLLLPLVRRRRDTLTAALLAGAAATVAGWAAAGAQSLPTWVDRVLGHPVQTYVDNAALPGTLARLTTPSARVTPLVDLPGGAVIGLLLGLVLVAVTAWLVRRPPTTGQDTAVWAMTGAALLASPLSWHNYLVLLMPGVLVLVAQGRWRIAALLLSLALIGMEWQWAWKGPGGTSPALALSLYCGILAAYWAAFVLARPRVPSLAGSPPTHIHVPAQSTGTVAPNTGLDRDLDATSCHM